MRCQTSIPLTGVSTVLAPSRGSPNHQFTGGYDYFFFEKLSKKVLTSVARCGILCRLSAGQQGPRGGRKKIEKSLKKLLTKESDCGIINKLSRRQRKRPKLIEN